MKRYQFITLSVLLLGLIFTLVFYMGRASASPMLQSSGSPTVVSYQGRVTDNGSPYTGTGHFKFAVVDGSGSTTYWSNDGTSSGGGEPTAAVQLAVTDGLFHVLLGDSNLSNMTSLPASVFSGTGRYLRVWFSTDGSSFTQLSPDRRVAAVPYALQAEEAASAGDADTLDGKDSSDFYTQAEVDSMISSLEKEVQSLQNKLSSVSTENGGDDLVFTGVNVHIRDGSGDTDGTTNGLGNLVIGYNEDDFDPTETRTGSHNLILGEENSYTGYGGYVAGRENTISAPFATISGGSGNTASGTYASVSGGSDNTAAGYHSAVSGGSHNAAQGNFSAVLGGGGSSNGNEAWAFHSVVVGGRLNIAGDDSGADTFLGSSSVILGGHSNSVTGDDATISGGRNNTASGTYASVSGGQWNEASGSRASVSGGNGNTAGGFSASVSGGIDNEASGSESSVNGGRHNTASGDYSAVLGGGGSSSSDGNEAWALYSVVAGGRSNIAGDNSGSDRSIGEASAVLAGKANWTNEDFASVKGGWSNTASGQYASVSAGWSNTASGQYASVSGGSANKASGNYSSVSGGVSNTASAENSSVSGGRLNEANGSRASISGGHNNTASGVSSSVSGGSTNIASGLASAVLGGGGSVSYDGNEAAGDYSTIGGGNGRSVSGIYDWRAGTLFETQ